MKNQKMQDFNLNHLSSKNFKRDRLFDNTRWVLVVEDDLDLQPFISSVLKEIDPNTKITWETSFKSAIDKITYDSSLFGWPPYELIIADIFLQGEKTGIGLWEELRFYESEMPFILITGAQEKAVEKLVGHHERVPLILQKPIDYEFFKQTIEFFYDNRGRLH
jgi:response regulator of citrate/malate metabolism